jgi:hypothetical protein
MCCYHADPPSKKVMRTRFHDLVTGRADDRSVTACAAERKHPFGRIAPPTSGNASVRRSLSWRTTSHGVLAWP